MDVASLTDRRARSASADVACTPCVYGYDPGGHLTHRFDAATQTFTATLGGLAEVRDHRDGLGFTRDRQTFLAGLADGPVARVDCGPVDELSYGGYSPLREATPGFGDLLSNVGAWDRAASSEVISPPVHLAKMIEQSGDAVHRAFVGPGRTGACARTGERGRRGERCAVSQLGRRHADR